MAESRTDWLRRRLVELADEVAALDAADFAEKHRLNTEADELRKELAVLSERDAPARAAWAERAARKQSHEVDPAVAEAVISSPIEGGGSV